MFALGIFGGFAIVGFVVTLGWIVGISERIYDWRVARRYRNHWRRGELPRADIRPAQRRGRR